MASNRNSPFNKKDQIRVRVVNSKGEVTEVECKTRLSVDRIKLSALTNFIGDQVVAFKTIDQYRIVSVQKKRILSCSTPIRDEEIASGDTLLLLEKRSVQDETSSKWPDDPLSSLKGPSISIIIEATRCIPPKNHQFHVKEHDVEEQFDRDLRPIFVTLVDYASTILQFHPEVEPILKNVQPFNIDDLQRGGTGRKRKNVPTENDTEQIYVDSFKQSTDMRFSPDRSKRSLRMNNMSPSETMNLLMDYETHSTSCKQPTTSSSDQINPLTTQLYPKVPAIIDCVNKFNRRNFLPTESVFNNLKQLGFDDDKILDAMWRFTNNQVLSTEWLITLNRPKLANLCLGLKYDHPFIKEIVNSPDIIKNLIKPKTFFALVSLVESIDCREVLIDDCEITFFVQELFRVYHSLYNHCGFDSVLESEDDQR